MSIADLEAMIKTASKASRRGSSHMVSLIHVNKRPAKCKRKAHERYKFMCEEENKMEIGGLILRVRQICATTFHAIHFTKRDKRYSCSYCKPYLTCD